MMDASRLRALAHDGGHASFSARSKTCQDDRAKPPTRCVQLPGESRCNRPAAVAAPNVFICAETTEQKIPPCFGFKPTAILP